MAWEFVHYEQKNTYSDFGFHNTSVEEIANQVDYLLRANGYELELGSPVDGVYGIGNDLAHVLLGVFVKRFKFRVHIWDESHAVYFRFEKGMTGAMGGIIGYSRMNSETSRIAGLFHEHFFVPHAGLSGLGNPGPQ